MNKSDAIKKAAKRFGAQDTASCAEELNHYNPEDWSILEDYISARMENCTESALESVGIAA